MYYGQVPLGLCYSNPQLFTPCSLQLISKSAKTQLPMHTSLHNPPSFCPSNLLGGTHSCKPTIVFFLFVPSAVRAFRPWKFAGCTNTIQRVQPRKQIDHVMMPTPTHRHLGLLRLTLNSRNERERERSALIPLDLAFLCRIHHLFLFSLLLHEVHEQMSNLLFMAHQNA